MSGIIIHGNKNTSEMFDLPDTMQTVTSFIDLKPEEYSKIDKKYQTLELLLEGNTSIPKNNQLVLYTIIYKETPDEVKKIFYEGLLPSPMMSNNEAYEALRFGEYKNSEKHKKQRKESLKIGLGDISLAGQDLFVPEKIDEHVRTKYYQVPLSDILLDTWNDNSLGHRLGIPLTRDVTGIINEMKSNNAAAVALKLVFDDRDLNRVQKVVKAEHSEDNGISYRECLALEREPSLDDIFISPFNKWNTKSL